MGKITAYPLSYAMDFFYNHIRNVVDSCKTGRMREKMLEVRELRIDELEKLLALYTELHDNPIPSLDDRILSIWQKMCSDSDHHVLGGFLDDELVSSCILQVIPNLTHRQRPYALIENVITLEKCRGRGYAGTVLASAKELAIHDGCYKIMLLTGAKKEETLRFYEKCGYNKNDKTAFIQWL